MGDVAQLSTSLRRGTLEFCVLAMVEHEDRYGTELVRRLGEERGLAASEGTIYPLLSRLRRSGWLNSKWGESPSGPPRRYYSLTDEGRDALAHFRIEWVSFRQTVDRLVGTEPARSGNPHANPETTRSGQPHMNPDGGA